MIYFEIKKKDTNDILLSNLEDFEKSHLFRGLENQNLSNSNYRNAYREDDSYKVRIVGDKQHEFFKANAIVLRTANTCLAMAPLLENLKRDNAEAYKIFSHNLVSTSARLQDEVEYVLPASDLFAARTYSEQLALALRLFRL